MPGKKSGIWEYGTSDLSRHSVYLAGPTRFGDPLRICVAEIHREFGNKSEGPFPRQLLQNTRRNRASDTEAQNPLD
jgi:hypothetical protein